MASGPVNLYIVHSKYVTEDKYDLFRMFDTLAKNQYFPMLR